MKFLKHVLFVVLCIVIHIDSYGQFGPGTCGDPNSCDPQEFYNGNANKFYLKFTNRQTNGFSWNHDWVVGTSCSSDISMNIVPNNIPVISGQTGSDKMNLFERRVTSTTTITASGFSGNFSIQYFAGCGAGGTENICVLKKSGQFGKGLLLTGAQLELDGSYTIVSQTDYNVPLNFAWQGDAGYCNEVMKYIGVYEPYTGLGENTYYPVQPYGNTGYEFQGAQISAGGYGQHEYIVRMSDQFQNLYTTIPIKVNIVPTCYSEVPNISIIDALTNISPRQVGNGYTDGDNVNNPGGYSLTSGVTYTLKLGLNTADYCRYFETIVDDGSALANNGNNDCSFSCTPLNRIPGGSNHLDLTASSVPGQFNLIVHDAIGFFTIHPQRKLCLGTYCTSFKPINIMVGGENLVSEIIPCLITLPQDLYVALPNAPRSAGANQFLLRHFTFTVRSSVGIIVQDGVVLQDGAVLKIDTEYQQPDAEKVDNNKNWTQQWAYDDAGQIIGESKSYFNSNGTVLQSQVKNLSQHVVLASETLYDKYKRPYINTLAAPVRVNEASTSLPCGGGTLAGGDLYFIYKSDFSSGYSFTNFDSYNANQYLVSESYAQAHPITISKENNPDGFPTSTSPGTLSWYYGLNNINTATSTFKEPLVAATAYPYSRTLAYSDGTGEVKSNTLPGDVFKAGGGYVGEQKIKALVSSEDLSYLTAYCSHYGDVFPGLSLNATSLLDNAYKVYQKDNEGRESYTYYTKDDKVFMTRYVPTNDQVYQYYDAIGRLTCSISPNGINQLAAGGLFTAIDKTSYTYNYRGWVLSTKEIDVGLTKFMYRKDGILRFSQNAEQALTGKYSYTNYDKVGRSIESGVFDPAGTTLTFSQTSLTSSVLESTAIDGGLIGGTKSEQIMTHYDLADLDPIAPQGTTFLVGKVSYTEKPGVSKTWFSYDERGRMIWSAQWLQGFGATVAASIHKVEYRYDYSGNVQEVAYNRGQGDQFYHVYQYDADNRIAQVFTSTTAPTYTLTGQPDKSSSLLRQAAYSYYLHGPLKRTELANGLQGIDYVYTAQGWLKSMNSFRPNTNRDPGADGNDLFGMSIDYYNGDYLLKPGGVIGSPSIAGLTVPQKHSGNIRAVTWFSQKPTYDNTSSDPTAYQYTYDNKDQLTAAQWGPIVAPTDTYNASFLTMYAEKGITYDANGNMKSLQRYDNTGNFLQTGITQTGIATHNFTAYHYQGNTNRLTSIDGYNTTYAYNAIGQMQSASNGTKNKYPIYDARGMVTSVTSDAAHADPYVKSYYDDNGLRYKKQTYHAANNMTVTTWYKYDASGNILAIYDDNNATQVLQKTETPIYASSRIGSYYHGVDNADHYRYELTDHLGTVRATFSPDPVTPAVPKVESYADYYPYGLVLRSAVAERYRFGYQGQYAEYDPETGTNHFELRDYDPIIGRWLGPDPYQEFYSAYVGMGNNPVSVTDPSGGSTGGGPDPEPVAVHVNDPNLVIHEPEFVLNGIKLRTYLEKVFWYQYSYPRVKNDPVYIAFHEGMDDAANLVGLFMMGEGLLTLGVEGAMYLSARSAVANFASKGLTNTVPNRLARIIPGNISGKTLGAPGSTDVFVTAADDIIGLNAKQIASRLAIPYSRSGFKVIEFNTSRIGIASPINRMNPGFVGFGRTAGGAREFVIPNQLIPNGSIIRMVR